MKSICSAVLASKENFDEKLPERQLRCRTILFVAHYYLNENSLFAIKKSYESTDLK